MIEVQDIHGNKHAFDGDFNVLDNKELLITKDGKNIAIFPTYLYVKLIA